MGESDVKALVSIKKQDLVTKNQLDH